MNYGSKKYQNVLELGDKGRRRPSPKEVAKKRSIYRHTRVFARDPEEVQKYCRDFNNWMSAMCLHPREAPQMPFIAHSKDNGRDTLDMWWRMKRVKDLWRRKQKARAAKQQVYADKLEEERARALDVDEKCTHWEEGTSEEEGDGV